MSGTLETTTAAFFGKTSFSFEQWKRRHAERIIINGDFRLLNPLEGLSGKIGHGAVWKRLLRVYGNRSFFVVENCERWMNRIETRITRQQQQKTTRETSTKATWNRSTNAILTPKNMDETCVA
jgi:hypothetical protein